MRRILAAIPASLIAVMTLAACLGPSGMTAPERQNSVLNMRDEAITELFDIFPQARADFVRSYGVGVFANFGTNLFLASTANGYGVVEDRFTREQTYMRMFSIGTGPGLGVKDYRAVLFFTRPGALDYFVANGWDVNLQADIAAVGGRTGGMFASAGDFNPGIKLYQFTMNGVAAQATIQGAKFWRDDQLRSLRASAGL